MLKAALFAPCGIERRVPVNRTGALKLLCQEESGGFAERLVVTEALLEIVHHAPVDDVGELALEDPHRLLLGVTAPAGVGEDALRVRGGAVHLLRVTARRRRFASAARSSTVWKIRAAAASDVSTAIVDVDIRD